VEIKEGEMERTRSGEDALIGLQVGRDAGEGQDGLVNGERVGRRGSVFTNQKKGRRKNKRSDH